jgi:hypothetical protein
MKIRNGLILISSFICSLIFYNVFVELNSKKSSIIGYPSFNDFNAVPDMAKYLTLTLFLPLAYLFIYLIVNYKKLFANINIHQKIPGNKSETSSDLLLILFCLLPSAFFIGQTMILKIATLLSFIIIALLISRLKNGIGRYLGILSISISNISLTLINLWNINFWKFTSFAKNDVIISIILCAIIFVFVIILNSRKYFINYKLFLRHTFAFSVILIIFNLFYNIPGPIAEIDVFHEGEWLAPAFFLLNGLTPYVDFQPIHGILKDGIIQLIGFKLFGTTIYSARLIDAMLSKSLMIIGFYFLGLTIFKRHRVSFSLIFLLLISTPWFNQIFYSDLRYAPIPFFLSFLIYLNRNPANKKLIILLPFFSILSIFLSPEMFLLSLGANFYILIKSIIVNYYNKSSILKYLIISNLSAVLFLSISPIGFGVIEMIKEFSSNLWQVSSIPIDLSKIARTGTAILILALVLPFINYLLVLRDIKQYSFFSQNNGIKLLISLSTSLSLSKYFTRADTHIMEVVPILLALILISLDKLDNIQIRDKFPIIIKVKPQFMLGFLVLLFALHNNTYQQRSPFDNKTPVLLDKVGPIVSGFEKDKVYLDMVKLKKNLDEIDSTKYIFDFSNAPLATFFYSERLPVSKYFTMTSAARPSTQEKIINELIGNPSVVVWDGPGFRAWDQITNNIRNYKVAGYLIGEYAPQVSDPDSYTLWQPADKLVQNKITGVQVSEYKCEFFLSGNNFESNSIDKPVKLKSEILNRQLYIKLDLNNKKLGKNNLINIMSGTKILATSRMADSNVEFRIPFLDDREVSNIQITFDDNLNKSENFKLDINPSLKSDTKIQLTKDISVIYNILSIEDTIRISDFTNINKLTIKNNNVQFDTRKIIKISGWAINSNGEPFEKIYIIDENKKIISEYSPDINRPDLSSFNPSSNDNYGFNIELYENKSKSIQKIYIVDENFNSIPMPKSFENKIKDFGYTIDEEVNSSLGWLENIGVNTQNSYLYLDRGDVNQSISFAILIDESVLELPINACEQNFKGRSYYGYLRVPDKDLEVNVRKIDLFGNEGGL